MILPAIALALWSTGWIVLGRVRRCAAAPAAPAAADLPALASQLSIVIPARNEETNLPALLRSLDESPVRPREIIVVDDASADRTAEIARAHGASVLVSNPLPELWRGKTWACHQGAQTATGDILLFLDADTWFEPDGLGRVLEEFRAAGGGALSLAPYHAVRAGYEDLSAFFNLIMLAGTGGFTVLGDRLAPRGLLGQFLMIERAAYQSAGGHEAVKDRILENFWFAERLRALGVRLRCRSGRGVLSFRMYPHGWRDLIDGWTKGFASGAGQTPLPILLLIIAWMVGLMLPLVGIVFSGPPLAWAAAYGLCVAQVGWMFSRVGRFRRVTALLYPVSLVFYFVVFGRSLLRLRRKQTVQWKGRQIRAD